MIHIYKLFQHILKLFVNLLFVVQVSLMVLIFFTAAYWFFDLIGQSYFEFVAPLANFIIKVMNHIPVQQRYTYNGEFNVQLLLFNFLALISVFALSKVKIGLYITMEKVEFAIEKCMGKIETKFNKGLQHDHEKSMKKMNSVAILVEFELKSNVIDMRRSDEDQAKTEKAEEAFKFFYESLKTFPECKFAKTDNKVLILFNGFEQTEMFLNCINESISTIRSLMKKKRWELKSFIAVDVYDEKHIEFKEIFPSLQKLMNMKIKNEITCYGNFVTRYDIEDEQRYQPTLKGNYAVEDGKQLQVWSLIKKN